MMLRKVRSDVQKMVTVDYLEKEVLKGKDLEELEESELQDLQSQFLVVTVPADFEPYTEEGVELNDEKIEEQKVEASPEFEAATEIYNNTVSGVASSMFFGTIFLILLTRKLDGRMDGNWWVVFVPIFLERGLKWFLNLFRCACGRMVGDEIIVQMNAPSDAKKEDREDANTGDKEPSGNNDDVEASAEEKGSKPEAPEEETKMAEALSQENEETPALSNAKETALSDSDQKLSSESPETGEEPQKEEGDNIHIDEETFRAWQNAYAEAEESAMQEQAKASSECLNITLQLILLCLVVAKIDQSYGSEVPNDIGFSSFWILFPFFLFFGLICCCCTLLIYGAAPGSADDLHDAVPDEANENDPENSNASGSTSPIVVVPASGITGQDAIDDVEMIKEKVDAVEAAAVSEQPTTSVKQDIDDLD